MTSEEEDDSTATGSEYIYSSDSEASYHLLDVDQNWAADDAWYSNRAPPDEYDDIDVYEEAATASVISYSIDPDDFEAPGDLDWSDSEGERESDTNNSDSGNLDIGDANYNSDEDPDWEPYLEDTDDSEDDYFDEDDEVERSDPDKGDKFVPTPSTSAAPPATIAYDKNKRKRGRHSDGRPMDLHEKRPRTNDPQTDNHWVKILISRCPPQQQFVCSVNFIWNSKRERALNKSARPYVPMGPRTRALPPKLNRTKEEIENARRIREEEIDAAIKEVENIRLCVKRQVVQAAKEACKCGSVDAFFFLLTGPIRVVSLLRPHTGK